MPAKRRLGARRHFPAIKKKKTGHRVRFRGRFVKRHTFPDPASRRSCWRESRRRLFFSSECPSRRTLYCVHRRLPSVDPPGAAQHQNHPEGDRSRCFDLKPADSATDLLGEIPLVLFALLTFRSSRRLNVRRSNRPPGNRPLMASSSGQPSRAREGSSQARAPVRPYAVTVFPRKMSSPPKTICPFRVRPGETKPLDSLGARPLQSPCPRGLVSHLRQPNRAGGCQPLCGWPSAGRWSWCLHGADATTSRHLAAARGPQWSKKSGGVHDSATIIHEEMRMFFGKPGAPERETHFP